MRLSTVVLAACLAGLAATAAAEDRFGPTRAVAAPERTAAVFDDLSVLRWNGKTRGQAAQSSDLRDLQPQPLADGLLRNTSASPFARRLSAPAASQPAETSQTFTPPPATPQAAPQPAPQVISMAPAPSMQAAAPLPSSLFDAAPDPAEATASTAPMTRARIAANAANANGQAPTRLYSVHSGYGMTPDPIPLAQTGVGQ